MDETQLEKELESILEEAQVETEWASRKLQEANSSIPDTEKRRETAGQLKALLGVAQTQEKVLRHLRKGNNREAFHIFARLAQKQKELDYESLYSNLVNTGIAGEDEAQKVIRLQEHSEELEQDLLEKVEKMAERTEKSSYRPTIYFEESVLQQVYREMEDMTLADQVQDTSILGRLLGRTRREPGKEFAALMEYERVEDGLKVVASEIDEGNGSSRNESSVYWSTGSREKLQTPRHNVIGFHTHPRGRSGTYMAPSGNDIEFNKGLDTGIAVVGYATPDFMRPEAATGLFAFSIQEHGKKKKTNTWIYLPISVTSGGRDVTESYPEIAAYNYAVQVSAEENYRSLPHNKRTEKLAELMEKWWQENL
jgi:hypothetical protein